MFASLFESLGHLPVAGIATDVAAKVLGGTVTIVASATGSGKTLLLPPSLAYASGEMVVVCVPRRFLAVNAAETVADLAGLTLGEEIGYAVGAQSGEESFLSDNVLYCTYGYAIASDLIRRAKTVVLDEVHEASLDMSICRALLHRRLAAGEKVNVLEMSATINAERQAAYWQNVASVEVVAIDGRTFPCERLHRPGYRPEHAVQELLEKGRTGILVFRPGRGEVEETAAAIRALVGEDVEVAEIYGELDYLSRKAAVAAPQGKAKVLVGTNVVESGANIPWLDAGVSCGTAKELSVRPETGATFLSLIDLPRWRLDQQEGRVKRFRDGIFILCGQLSYEQRTAETTPEILRLPLTELVMHCASFGIRAEDLTFDYAPEKARILEAETKLQRLGLIDPNCRLTKAGHWVSKMPVGPETGAMLWHAKQLGVLGAALPLAAVIEVDGIRKEFRAPHYQDFTSDWLDGLKAFLLALGEKDGTKRREVLENTNISYKRFTAAKELLKDLQRRLGAESGTLAATDVQLRQCLVAGFITNLFVGDYQLTMVTGNRYTDYNIGNGSAAQHRSGDFALGQLRTIKPKDTRKASFTVVEKVTDVTLDDILAVAKLRPSLITTEESRQEIGYFQYQTVSTRKLFGEYELGKVFGESPLTPEEAETKAEMEAAKRPLCKQLETLNPLREELGLGAVIFYDEYFRLSRGGRSYAYREDLVAMAMQDHLEQVAARRAELEAARRKAEHIAALRPQFEALRLRRKDTDMKQLDLTDKMVYVGWVPYDYTEATLVFLTEELESHLATQAEAKAQAEANAAKVASGKTRIQKLNLRREALGWKKLDMFEIEFWNGTYIDFTNDAGLQAAEQEVVAEEKKRAYEAAQSQSTVDTSLLSLFAEKFRVGRR